MQHYQLPQEKVKHFVVVIGTIFLLTINMCDRGRTITHLQIPRFHTQVWYNIFYAMMTSSNGNIPRVTGPLWGESTGPRWIPLTKYSDAGLWCFLWSAPEQTIEQPVIWDVIALIIAVMAGKMSPWDDKQTQYIAKCWVMTWKKFPGRNSLQKTTTYKRWWVIKQIGRKAGCCTEDKQQKSILMFVFITKNNR